MKKAQDDKKPKLTPSQKAAITKQKAKDDAEAARVEGNITRELVKLRRAKEYYLNPKRTFIVDQEVEVVGGFWPNAKIVAVEDEGLFYRIAYGEKESSRRERYIAWTELTEAGSKIETKVFNTRKTDWVTYIAFYSTSLEGLVSKHLSAGVDFNPEYQRELVWSLSDKQSLIDSIFKGIEIGKFVFIPKKDDTKSYYEILDGKQRLATILEFMRDGFPYQGTYYSQLSNEDIKYFDGYLVSSGETREDLTPKQKYEYFLRLNTKGVEQSSEHLAKVRKMLEDIK